VKRVKIYLLAAGQPKLDMRGWNGRLEQMLYAPLHWQAR